MDYFFVIIWQISSLAASQSVMSLRPLNRQVARSHLLVQQGLVSQMAAIQLESENSEDKTSWKYNRGVKIKSFFIDSKRWMKISDQKGEIPTRDRSFNDQRRRRSHRHRGCYLFSCSSFGSHRRTKEVFKFPNKEERRKRDLEFSESSKRNGSLSLSLIGLL